MSRLRLSVQHCVLARVVRQYGPHPTSDLLGVDYYLTVPADVEFPRFVAGMELFARFFVRYPRPARVWITITRLWRGGIDRDQIYQQRFTLAFPTRRVRVMVDVGLKLRSVSFPGVGRYAVRVLRPTKSKWQTEMGWRVLATEYIRVERGP